MTIFRPFLCAAAAISLHVGSVQSAVSVDVTVSGNEVTATVETPVADADLTISFDNAIGLSASSIGISAAVINPADLTLLARLPSGMSIPAAFPLMITVEPPDDQGLSFTDTALVEIHTHALALVTNSPLRLMKAPLGGQFEDITESLAAGSVRSRGRTGGFSQFIIAVDIRSHTSMAAAKLDVLDDDVDSSQIPTAIQTTLQSHVDAARTDLNTADYLGAIAELEALLDVIDAESGTSIPNVWRATRDLDNVAGRIAASASTLIFSLRMANALTL